jgi:hypothetical protein
MANLRVFTECFTPLIGIALVEFAIHPALGACSFQLSAFQRVTSPVLGVMALIARI